MPRSQAHQARAEEDILGSRNGWYKGGTGGTSPSCLEGQKEDQCIWGWRAKEKVAGGEDRQADWARRPKEFMSSGAGGILGGDEHP